MHRTRLSLFYLAGYLLIAGIMLLFTPQFTLELFLSTANYDDVLPRFVGMFFIGVGVVIVQLIRFELEVLYLTTVFVRTFFVICFISFYFMNRDPFFLVLLAIVIPGVVFTSVSYFQDRTKGSG